MIYVILSTNAGPPVTANTR